MILLIAAALVSTIKLSCHIIDPSEVNSNVDEAYLHILELSSQVPYWSVFFSKGFLTSLNNCSLEFFCTFMDCHEARRQTGVQ